MEMCLCVILNAARVSAKFQPWAKLVCGLRKGSTGLAVVNPLSG